TSRRVATPREARARRLAETPSQRRLLDGVAAAFGIDRPLHRVEVYDNSHIQGTHAVGAMIVAGPEGLVKNAYRKFTIRGIAAAQAGSDAADGIAGGDDYAMMREVLMRRFARAVKEDPA